MLIVGSGNVVHNLGVIQWGGKSAPYPWALQFNRTFRENLERRNARTADRLRGDWAKQRGCRFRHPTTTCLRCTFSGRSATTTRCPIVTDGIELGSISMLSFAFVPKQDGALTN